MESLLFQTSLIASFVAGMVALFAPCCITFLLPAYLGSVFKEKEKVLLMTFVFGLGIFVVLLPAVLGVALISQFLFRYHNGIYLVSGLVMIIVSVITLLGIKLPMPNLPGMKTQGKVDVFSIFTLGIFSGITSACCAPVLVGILAMTFLSPTFWGALLLGGMYVLGMIAPLFIISALLSGKMPNLAVLRRPLTSVKFLGKEHMIVLSNLIAFVIFFTTGVLTLFLTYTGRLSMSSMSAMTSLVKDFGGAVNSLIGGNIFINIIFLIGVIYLFYRLSKRI